MITSYDLEKEMIKRRDLSSIVLDNIARSSIDLWQRKIFFLDRKYPKFQFQCSHRNEPRLCAQTDSSTILLMNPKSSSFFLKILYCFEENQVSQRWNDHVGCWGEKSFTPDEILSLPLQVSAWSDGWSTNSKNNQIICQKEKD